MSDSQNTNNPIYNLGLLFLKNSVGKENYEKIEVVSKLLSDEEYGDNCYVALLAKKESLECIVVNPEGKERKASKTINIQEHSVPELKEKIELSYVVDGRIFNLSYDPKCTDGVYFKMELLPKAEQK